MEWQVRSFAPPHALQWTNWGHKPQKLQTSDPKYSPLIIQCCGANTAEHAVDQKIMPIGIISHCFLKKQLPLSLHVDMVEPRVSPAMGATRPQVKEAIPKSTQWSTHTTCEHKEFTTMYINKYLVNIQLYNNYLWYHRTNTWSGNGFECRSLHRTRIYCIPHKVEQN